MSKKRYSAKLMWQFRVQKGTESKRKRVCEEQIVVFSSVNAEKALKKANRYGSEYENSTCIDEEQQVMMHTEFLGVLDLVELTDWDEEDEFLEVWFDHYDRLMPLERKDQFVPPKEKLREFRDFSKRPRGKVKIKW